MVWATEKDYTIILLDIKMPHMNGIEFLEGLRQKKPDAPVLIITGYPSIPNAAAAMRLGACDYVTKPFTAEEITWAVRRVLSTHQVPTGEDEAGAANAEADLAIAGEEKLFWDESWWNWLPTRQVVSGQCSRGFVGHPSPRSGFRASERWFTKAFRWPA